MGVEGNFCATSYEVYRGFSRGYGVPIKLVVI